MNRLRTALADWRMKREADRAYTEMITNLVLVHRARTEAAVRLPSRGEVAS